MAEGRRAGTINLGAVLSSWSHEASPWVGKGHSLFVLPHAPEKRYYDLQSMEQESPSGNLSEADARLDQMFRAYREAFGDPDASANFMPDLWLKIEAREVSTNWFGRVAKMLVAAALTASAILGMMISSTKQPDAFFNSSVVDALRANHASTLEPFRLDRISDLDLQ